MFVEDLVDELFLTDFRGFLEFHSKETQVLSFLEQ